MCVCFKYFSLNSLRAPLGSNCRTTGLPSASGKCVWSITHFSGRGRMFGFLPNKMVNCWGHLYQGGKCAGKTSWNFLFLSSQWSLFVLSVPLPVLCWGRDTAHAGHRTRRGQRTTLGIRAHLPLGSPVPDPYRHARSTLPRFKSVWGIRTRDLVLVWHPPPLCFFFETQPLYSPSYPEDPNSPPPTSWELESWIYAPVPSSHRAP